MKPNVQEFKQTLKQMRSSKSPGPESSSFDIKHGGLPFQTHIFTLILKMWKYQQVPKEMKDAVIIIIFKKVTEMSVAIIQEYHYSHSMVYQNPSKSALDHCQILPESQCGFKIFYARQLHEKKHGTTKTCIPCFSMT